MRVLFIMFIAAAAVVSAARADQTDPRLVGLFKDLRTGGTVSTDVTTASIREIWSRPASDSVAIIFARAEATADAGDLALAETLLDHVVALAPSFAQGYAVRGMVRLRSQDRAGAIADFVQAIDLEPRHFEARIALGEIFLGNGDKSDALEMYHRALEWNPHDRHALDRARRLRREIEGQGI